MQILVINAVKSETKAGKAFVKASVMGIEPDVKTVLNIWDIDSIKALSLIEVSPASMKDYQGMKSVSFHSLVITPLEEWTTNKVYASVYEKFEKYLPKLPSEELWTDLVRQIIDASGVISSLSAFALKMAHVLYPKYSKYPAATINHHAYEGGLLVHTFQMLNLLKGLMSVYPFECNFLQCAVGIMFHDFGKLYEYNQDGSRNIFFDLKGHPVISTLKFENAAKSNDLSVFDKEMISHIILSHHQKKEYGSPVIPCTQEAYLVSMIDAISGIGDAYECRLKSNWLGTTIHSSEEIEEFLNSSSK